MVLHELDHLRETALLLHLVGDAIRSFLGDETEDVVSGHVQKATMRTSVLLTCTDRRTSMTKTTLRRE